MVDLDANLTLQTAKVYDNPRRSSDSLPLVYGEMAGGSGGLWEMICIDTESYVYALAGHPLLSLESGNQVTLYDRDDNELDPSGYVLDLDHAYQGRINIATATFASDMSGSEPLAARAAGRLGQDGRLLTNPLDIARDLLLSWGGLSDDDLDRSAFGRARARATDLGYAAGGVIGKKRTLAKTLTDLLGDFMGSWWLGADGKLKLSLDLGSGAVDEGELAAVLVHSHLKSVEVSAKLANLVNQAQVYYCYNQLSQEFEEELDLGAAQDLASQGLYGQRSRDLELNWVRDSTTASTIASRLIGFLSSPRRLISCEEDALTNLALEKGDAALFSLPWLADEMGRPLMNQIVRVMALEPQLDKGTIRFTLLDTGFAKTITRLADGGLRADASTQAGGERDRTEYAL